MATTEMITVIPTAIKEGRTFKDDRLAKATDKIIKIYSQAAKFADEKNREIAKILATIAEQKSYTKDGFKSVADYANELFGIQRQNAYALANAGKVYNDAQADATLKAMTPSKLAAIASVAPEKVKEAIASGAIKSTSTQQELKDFATKSKGDDVKVLQQYTAKPRRLVYTEEQSVGASYPRTMEEWEAFFTKFFLEANGEEPEIIKLPKGKVNASAKKATVNRTLFVTHSGFDIVDFYVYNPPKAPKAPKAPKFTAEELRAMLAELEAKEDDGDTNNEPQILPREAEV